MRAAVAMLALAGCGTMLGKQSPLVLTSSPAGAEVFVDGVARGKTPVEIAVSTREHHHVEFQLDGRTGSCEIAPSTSGMWIAIDIAFGLVPLVVDAATGGWHALDFDACAARFE